MSKHWLSAPALCLLLMVSGTPSMAQSESPRDALSVRPADECVEDYALVYPCVGKSQAAEAGPRTDDMAKQFAHRMRDQSPDTVRN